MTAIEKKAAKKVRNIEAANKRFAALQAQQRREKTGRVNASRLLERANSPICSRQFHLWLKFFNRKATPGSAALFFATFRGIEERMSA